MIQKQGNWVPYELTVRQCSTSCGETSENIPGTIEMESINPPIYCPFRLSPFSSNGSWIISEKLTYYEDCQNCIDSWIAGRFFSMGYSTIAWKMGESKFYIKAFFHYCLVINIGGDISIGRRCLEIFQFGEKLQRATRKPKRGHAATPNVRQM